MSLLTSLISCWNDNTVTGQATDSQGGINLAGQGDSGTKPGTATALVDQAWQFTKSSKQYFSHASNASLLVGDIDFSLAGWVYLDTRPGNICGLFNKGTNASGAAALNAYNLAWNDDGDYFEWEVSNGSSVGVIGATNFGAPSTGTWYYVVCWHDSVNNLIGISVNNGTPNTAAWSAGVLDDSSFLFLMGTAFGSGNSRTWDGRIGQGAFWKKVLSSTEIIQLYNSGAGLAFTSWGGGGGVIPLEQVFLNQAVKAAAYF